MNKLHLTLAAALALGAQFASAQVTGPFEGGQAASNLAPFTSTADRATVAAEGRDTARRINSRSGHQGATEQIINTRVASTRSRADVRAEAAAAHDLGVYEGGQAGTVVTRAVTPSSDTLASGTANIVR
ncbi:MAG: hypothetical protein EOO24_26390 [Comamonadaceae bacterium]|nr:MAG: hypothetical protein EOO24_26390 [Comamonadaceae bacterium]